MQTGDRLGDRYEVRKAVGEGGAAQVYLGWDPIMQRDVAIKAFVPTQMSAHESAEQFTVELQALGRLEHPHILPIYDAGTHGDISYIIMRYADRGSLTDEIARGLPTIDRAFIVIFQTGRGLAYAHHHGVVHRDVKPRNILVEESGDVYLSDFSLAVAKTDAESAGPMLSKGTASYMSPEQWCGEAVTPRSDVYALAATLFETLTGRPPYEGMGSTEILPRLLTKPPESIIEHRPDLPPALAEAVQKGMAKNPEDRPETALGFVSIVKRSLSG